MAIAPASKISKPTLAAPVLRERLFTLLDHALASPVVWVAAPGGSGKSTTLATYLAARNLPCLWYRCDERDADLATFFYYMRLAAKQAAPRYKKTLPYLTPEYLAGIPVFTRHFFETLFDRLRPRSGSPAFIVVLDNYQDVPADALLHDMLAVACAAIPDHVHVVVLSRGVSPAPLARLHANGMIARLGYDEIRFSGEEARELILASLPSLEPGDVLKVIERCNGWAAGMILLLEQVRHGGNILRMPGDEIDDRVFDYFAGEVFGRMKRDHQEFLLKTTLLPVVSVQQARQLTGANHAGEILNFLNSQHLFTEKLSGSEKRYQYHPLFREFLVSRLLSAFSAEQLTALRRMTAGLLEQSGQLDEAARLFAACGDYDSLALLVNNNGMELLMQGRAKTLSGWIADIPGDIVEHSPSLLYWSAMCLFWTDLRATGSLMEKALALFRAQGNSSGCYLAWAGIVDSHFLGDDWSQLDGCLSRFEELQRIYPEFSSRDLELRSFSHLLLALTLRKLDDPRQVEACLQRITALLLLKPDFNNMMASFFFMSVYYFWRGEHDKNALLLERASAEMERSHPSSFTLIRFNMMYGIHYWSISEFSQARKALDKALEISATSGARLYDSQLLSFKTSVEMASGNLEAAGLLLKQQKQSLQTQRGVLNLLIYHIGAAWHALLSHNPARAAEHMKTIALPVERCGMPFYRALWHIGMAQIVFEQGQAKQAESFVQAACEIGRDKKLRIMEWYALLVKSWFLLHGGNRADALTTLREALALGSRHGYYHLDFFQPGVVARLCATALDERIETSFVLRMIKKLALPPVSARNGADSALEQWPFPIKIYTFGRFEIIQNGEPLAFSGKAQVRQLELLKALVAFGGTNVSSERLMDALWPEADGDMASQSLRQAIHRLRSLLGEDKTIETGGGRVSLNQNHVWVDSIAFEYLSKTAREAWHDGHCLPKAVTLLEQAVALYADHFFVPDAAETHAVKQRESLRRLFIGNVEILGAAYMELRQWDKGAALYERGLEIDELIETFYLNLMRCHLEQNRRDMAVAAYNRCKHQLNSAFGFGPSEQMEALYRLMKS